MTSTSRVLIKIEFGLHILDPLESLVDLFFYVPISIYIYIYIYIYMSLSLSLAIQLPVYLSVIPIISS